MTESSAEIPHETEQEFTKPKLEPGFLSLKEQEVFEHLCDSYAKQGEPWFMAFVNTLGPTKADQLVKKVIVKLAWDSDDFVNFLSERKRRILYSHYLAQPSETYAQIAKKEGVTPSRVREVVETGIADIRDVWYRRWENTHSIEVSQEFPEFYLLTPAMPSWFKEIDLLDLGPDIRSKLAKNDFVKLSRLYEADYERLNACGLDHHQITNLRGMLEKFANNLIMFRQEREGQIPEDTLNNQAVLQKEVPPYFFDRRLKNHWRRLTEIDLLGLSTKERNDLKRVDIKGIRELDQMPDKELLEIRQVGRTELRKIRTTLQEFKWYRLGLLD